MMIGNSEDLAIYEVIGAEYNLATKTLDQLAKDYLALVDARPRVVHKQYYEFALASLGGEIIKRFEGRCVLCRIARGQGQATDSECTRCRRRRQNSH